MSRVKRGSKRRQKRKKILKLAKGYYGAKRKNYRTAKEAVERSLLYAYRDRRGKKRDFRRLWIIRINAAIRKYGISYSKFISALKKENLGIDRKILADLAVNEPETFEEIVKKIKVNLENA